MNGRFYFFGAVVSLALHGALFFLLAVGPCKARLPESPVPQSDVPAVAETNAIPSDASVSEPPQARSLPPPTLAEPVPAEPAPAQTERIWKTYVVKSGDTLMILSKRTGCTVSEIAKQNKKTVKAMARLKVGQRILLPTPQ